MPQQKDSYWFIHALSESAIRVLSVLPAVAKIRGKTDIAHGAFRFCRCCREIQRHRLIVAVNWFSTMSRYNTDPAFRRGTRKTDLFDCNASDHGIPLHMFPKPEFPKNLLILDAGTNRPVVESRGIEASDHTDSPHLAMRLAQLARRQPDAP